jgi:hypothetical protein
MYVSLHLPNKVHLTAEVGFYGWHQTASHPSVVAQENASVKGVLAPKSCLASGMN